MSIKNTAKGSFCPLQSKKKCPEKLSKIQTKCARSVFPFNLKISDRRYMMKIVAFFDYLPWLNNR